MGFSIKAAITPKAAARLLISGEIDLNERWTIDDAQSVFDELLEMSIDDLLQIVDSHRYGDIADIKLIPQFGKIETLLKVPSCFADNSISSLDYPQLGFYLKNDIDASLAANTKFGETHGKATSILGITSCVNKRIISSALTFAFLTYDSNQKTQIIKRLFFRIPVVQIILKKAAHGQFNGHLPMAHLKESTMHRRSQCLRAIFKWLMEFQNDNLSARIGNIIWEDV